MPFTTKLDFSDNRQVKQHIETLTHLSGGTIFGVPFNTLPTGPNLLSTGITATYNNLVSTFSGNSGTTIYSWSDSRMSLAESVLSAITPSNSASTQQTGQIYTANSTTIIDGNTIVLDYTGVSFSIGVTAMTDLGGGNYSGSLFTIILDILSAGTLDFTGRTIWVDVSGITRTQDLIITTNPQIGFVWTCSDSEGKGAWTPVSGTSGTSLTYWSASTGSNAIVVKNSNSLASGTLSLAEGDRTTASGTTAHAEGTQTSALGNYSHAEGQLTIAIGSNSHAEGNGTTAEGQSSHVEGQGSIATGTTAHAEGLNTRAFGANSHAEGNTTTALGDNSHAEGYQTTASGQYSHAGGSGTTASGDISYAEGSGTTALGIASHSEGYNTTASGNTSHSQGWNTLAGGDFSHSGGLGYDAFTKITAKGTAAFNHSIVTVNMSGALGVGANGIGSAILGGIDHKINVDGDYSVIIGGSGHTVNTSVMRSVIIGGGNLTASSNDYVYVPSLNINSVASGAFVNDIRIDGSGNLTTNTSDVRLKENINPIINALDIIKKLNGVTYQWIDKKSGGDDIKIGFIAQEVEKVDPRLVFKNKVDGFMGVHIDSVIPLLVEAIKELTNDKYFLEETLLHTQTILAEDNNIDLNYSGTQETAIGGGIRVLHSMGKNVNSEIITDNDGNWITNTDFKSKALTIPLYTPTSSNDINGNEGNITRDNNYLYIKTENGWKRSNLETF